MTRKKLLEFPKEEEEAFGIVQSDTDQVDQCCPNSTSAPAVVECAKTMRFAGAHELD